MPVLFDRKSLIDEIIFRLSVMETCLKWHSGRGENDACKTAEDVVARFLGALEGWSLVNLNTIKPNYPAADLGDIAKRIAIQVTVNDTAAKVRDTHEKATAHKLGDDFDELIILFLTPSAPSLAKAKDGFVPCTQPKITHWSRPELNAKVNALDLDGLRKALAILQDEMSGITQLFKGIPIRLSPPKFLHHAAEHFLGREPELTRLDTAWGDGTNVLSLIAWGGVGKTALISEWMQTRFIANEWKTDDGLPALMAYFDWTFYDQGTTARTGSVGDFFEKALNFFDDPDPNLPGKGRRLADLIRQQRSLIILDGLEPLQQPLGHPQAGRLLDPNLRDLIAALALSNPGLCIITSREPLKDIDGLKRTRYRSHDLEDLPVGFAIQLLRKFAITGNDTELATACETFHRHALSLTLLGRFLSDAYGGEIRRIDRLHDLKCADALTRPERHRSVWRILETYEVWLSNAQADGNPKTLAVLRLTGLFDRTATADCLAALRSKPIIPGLTDALCEMADDEWDILLKRLERAHLIKLRGSLNLKSPSSESAWAIDAHPLIREYFAQQLKETQPEAFKAAHSRLFDHLCETTTSRPDDLEGLEPLYQAIAHGCLAMRQAEAFDAVFIERILRGTGPADFYSSKVLGACASDLSAIRAFLVAPWPHISPFLLRAQAAIRLRSLGQIGESVELMREEVKRQIQEKAWHVVARLSGVLSDLEATAGLLSVAEDTATRATEYADLSIEPFAKWVTVICVANVLLFKGDITEALDLLEQRFIPVDETDPRFSVLASFSGHRRSELMLASMEREAWRLTLGTVPCQDQAPSQTTERFRQVCEQCSECAQQTLKKSLERGYLLDIALDRLSHAKAVFLLLLIETAGGVLCGQLRDMILETLRAFRRANELAHVPLGLLTAAFYHATLGGSLDDAERLLEEAQQIAERGPMPLYLADVHLHRARLFGRMPKDERQTKFPDINPKAELTEARRLIEKHGYWRRKEELQDAEAAAVNW